MREALARSTDPITSHAAAAQMSGAKHVERLVLGAVAQCGERGATADEVEAIIHSAHPGIKSHSITPRFKPLIARNLIYDTQLERPGTSGRMQRVVRVR